MVEPLEPQRHRSAPRPPVHHDDRLDYAVAGLVDPYAADAHGRAPSRFAPSASSASGEVHPLQQVRENVGRHPASDLLDLASTREDLNDAPGEVSSKRFRIRKRTPQRRLRFEERIRDCWRKPSPGPARR